MKFDRNDCSQTFANVFTRKVCIFLFQNAPLARKLINQRSQCGTESFFVSSALDCVDCVCEGINRFGVAAIPLHSNFKAQSTLFVF